MTTCKHLSLGAWRKKQTRTGAKVVQHNTKETNNILNWTFIANFQGLVVWKYRSVTFPFSPVTLAPVVKCLCAPPKRDEEMFRSLSAAPRSVTSSLHFTTCLSLPMNIVPVRGTLEISGVQTVNIPLRWLIATTQWTLTHSQTVWGVLLRLVSVLSRFSLLLLLSEAKWSEQHLRFDNNHVYFENKVISKAAYHEIKIIKCDMFENEWED